MTKSFLVEIEKRWADIDLYGHVNNVVLFSYLEIARVNLWKQTDCDFVSESLQLLVARAECDYLKPILLSDRVVITMEIPRLGRSSYDIHYQVHDGDSVTYATAKTVMVCYDKELKQTVTIPEAFRSAVSSRCWGRFLVGIKGPDRLLFNGN